MTLIIPFNNDWLGFSAPKKNENCYQQVFLKEWEYIVTRHINDNLIGFSSSDESDEEYIKDQVNDFFREQFWKRIFWGSTFNESNEE